MGFFSNKKTPKEPEVSTDTQTIAQELYKHNVELAVKNKTLSLLSKLYDISLIQLEPAALAQKITATVRTDLEFEVVAIFLYDEQSASISPLGYSASAHTASISPDLDTLFRNNELQIKTASSPILSGVVEKFETRETEVLDDIWGGLLPLPKAALQTLRKDGHIRSSLLYPLVSEGKVIGILLLCLNRAYSSLVEYEKESIHSIINVTAIALDKALIYRRLEITNQNLAVANDQLKELDRQKSEFVSIASHQLRSPLTAMKGYSSMLLEGSFGKLDDKARDAVDRIFQSSQRLVVIIEDFLNLSRIEQGRMQYEFSTTNLGELTAGVVKEMEAPIKNAGLSITYKQPQEQFLIKVDSGKVRQVIANVIDNAIKYTKQGGITVAISREPRMGKVRLSVTDTGIGIAPEIIPKLFQKFSRAGDAGKVNILGTGLGLFVAKEIMQAHNGRIWVESPGPGKGSTFYLEFLGE